MSETNLATITAERDSFKQQLEETKNQSAAQIDALQNNLQAHQEMLNEALQVSLNLRTNIHAFQKHNKKLTASLHEHSQSIINKDNQIKDLTDKNAVLQAKIDELSNVPVTESVAA